MSNVILEVSEPMGERCRHGMGCLAKCSSTLQCPRNVHGFHS